MRIAVSGSTGLVGSALISFLHAAGHRALRIARSGGSQADHVVAWDQIAGRIDADGLEGVDAVVHLAGESIASRRWNASQKERIRSSRVQGSELLSRTLARLRRRPAVLVSASAIGFYGDRGDEELDERSPGGDGFLPDVCRQWEAATQSAAEAGIRVTQLRFGVVLSAAGGALAKMLTPFRLGLGGRIGDGRQWMSWIALDDAVGCIDHVIRAQDLRGPVNAITPQPVTNREFTDALGKILRRPTLLPVPRWIVRLALGEMADALLLSSTRVIPRALVDSQYRFRCPDLEGALRHVLQLPDGV